MTVIEKKDIPYKSCATLSDYEKERCKLDLYLPEGMRDFPALVWFHGGALEMGDKAELKTVAEWLAGNGIAVVSVNYRLSPRALFPAYIEDAASSVAWVQAHAQEYGINPRNIHVGGHSAGAYLAAMLAMDESYLLAAGGNPNDLAGAFLISGQMTTHSTVIKERGVPERAIVSDSSAPAYYVRKDTIPMFFVAADNDEPARLEGNQFFVASLVAAGNKSVKLEVISGRTHLSICEKMLEPDDPCGALLVQFLRRGVVSRNSRGVC